MEVARVIITTKCNRNCVLCCNKKNPDVDNATRLHGVSYDMDAYAACENLSTLKRFDQVCITGGEPLLRPRILGTVIKAVRMVNNRIPIFLYTALYTYDLPRFMSMVDGVHYAIHTPATQKDIDGFLKFQNAIQSIPGSYRLHVESGVMLPVPVIPSLFKRVEFKPMTQNCPLPKNETLFILEE